MLIKQLKNDENLKAFIAESCCENEVCVEIDDEILGNAYTIIKVDKYYNANVPSPNTPKSPDCLIVQQCADEQYKIYVIELRNVKSQKNKYIDRSAIRAKFETCLLDFMSNRFRIYFYDENYAFKLHLILVAGKVSESKIKNFKFDFLLSLCPLRFANKLYAIQGRNPNPLIVPC